MPDRNSEAKRLAGICLKYTDLEITRITSKPIRFSHPITEINRRRLNVDSPRGSKPIRGYHPADEYQWQETEFAQFISKVSRWWPVSPGKAKVSAKLVETYLPYVGSMPPDLTQANVFPEDVKNYCKSYRSDSETPPPECNLDLILKKPAGILIVRGVRGVGKTAFLNFWLTINHRRFIENHVHWFRIDAAKVYEVYNKLTAQGEDVSVHDIFYEYFMIHTMYVIFMYSEFFSDNGYDDVLRTGSNPVFKKWVDTAKKHNSQILSQTMDIFRNPLEDYLRGDPSESDMSQFIVRSMMRLIRKSDNYDVVSATFEALLKSMRERSTIYVLVDGIDNISWTKRNEFYRTICTKIGLILSEISDKVSAPIKYILAMRPETSSEISAVHGGQLVGFNSQNPGANSTIWTADIAVGPIKEILLHKLDAALEPAFSDDRMQALTAIKVRNDDDSLEESARITTSLKNTIGEMKLHASSHEERSVQSIHRSFDVATVFLSQRTYFPKTAGQQSIDKQPAISLLKHMCDDDIRAYIENFINVYFIRRHLNDVIPGNETDDRLIQYLCFNGQPFYTSLDHYKRVGGLSSRANYNERGAVLPNIFWYNTGDYTQDPSKWGGLCGLRILQIAAAIHDFKIGDLMYSCKKMFDYPTKAIEEAVEAFMAFGILDITSDINQNDPDDDAISPFVNVELESSNPFYSYSNNAEITPKGLFWLSYMWMRPDILYYYALDTPMISELVIDSSRHVRETRDFEDLSSVENFYSAATFTLTTFYAHIKTWHKLEMDHVNRAVESGWKFKNMFESETKLKRYLQMPVYMEDFFERFVVRALNSETREHVKGKNSKIAEAIGEEILDLYQAPRIHN